MSAPDINHHLSSYTINTQEPKEQAMKKSVETTTTSTQDGCCILWFFIVLGLLVGGIGLAITITLAVSEGSRSKITFDHDRNIPLEYANGNHTLRWNPDGVTVAGMAGINSSDANTLNRPWGLAVDNDFSLYIADRYNHRIQKYWRNSLKAVTIVGLVNGTSGKTNSTLNGPATILLDSEENLYIADGFNNRIQFWNSQRLSAITIVNSSSIVNFSKTLNHPYGVALDENNKFLYVADTDNHRILKYDLFGSFLGLVAGGNSNGTQHNQLNRPMCLYLDALSNSLLIANYQSHNIIRWTLGASSWTLVAGRNQNNAYTINSTSLSGPIGLTVDPMGNLYVADRNNHRILLFLNGSSTGMIIAGETAKHGNDSQLLNQPYAVALDKHLNLYVADTFNHRVQKFFRY